MEGATGMHVRDMIAGEADALGRVMFRAIHDGYSDYTKAQRIAWCAMPPEGEGWAAKLAAQDVRVVEALGAPVGFITRNSAYIDLAFVLPDWQGQGAFSMLYDRIEADARAAGLRRLWVHASLTAQPAFAAKGFAVTRHETVARRGETLDRAEMEKVFDGLT
ncbi:GNAT family N-acetyltransferase [uncultured Tateyamaria sp.]|uniref:GNAT family N-acetyltransferase n=1 Tax=uncultured Tateyamaria sp. TaxID=455651 RepID=UPI00262B1562|nr:GNAT family N-acetyltransferase [uncultured Tateyamaria sp.]